MENYTFCCGRVKIEHFREVPGDSLSFAVFIGSEPDDIGVRGRFLEFFHEFFLVVGYFIQRFEPVFNIDAETVFLKVSDMTVA